MRTLSLLILLAACSSGTRQTVTNAPPAPPAPVSSAPAPSAPVSSAVVRSEPPPPPARPASNDPSACASNDDCVIHCPAAEGCCPSSPCGCSQAVNRAAVGKVDADYANGCTKAPRCPAVDCAYKEAMFAECVRGRCVGRSGP